MSNDPEVPLAVRGGGMRCRLYNPQSDFIAVGPLLALPVPLHQNRCQSPSAEL
jgi:hypothetical protein